MRFLGHYFIPWIFQWSYTVGSHNNLYILARDLFYKWWPKYEFDELIPQMHLDLNAYKEYNLYVKEEEEARKADAFMNQEFKIPSAAALKKKYVDASPAEIKEKMLKAFIAHLGFLDDDSMSISSKATSRAPSVNLEAENEQDEEKEESEDFNENEDMEKYMGISWADQVEAAVALSKVKKEKAEDSKGKGTKGVGPASYCCARWARDCDTNRVRRFMHIALGSGPGHQLGPPVSEINLRKLRKIEKLKIVKTPKKIHQEKKLNVLVDKDLKNSYDRIELKEMESQLPGKR
ncbi:hypothetical protein LguiB_013205 [Lonicera macranthoides]